MTPVDQTVLTDGSGNCLAACVASILNLPIEAVPNFAESGFFDGLESWLAQRGLRMIAARFPDGEHFAKTYFGYSDGPVVLWGYGPRLRADGGRKQHAVVGQTNGYGCKTVHDPHPSRAGLDGHPYGVAWIVPMESKQAAMTDGIWRCFCCGEMKGETSEAAWRWNGTAWEHSHGQGGHHVARNFVTQGAQEV